jgi:Copper/zinc superoxide dismutase (SODC)
VIVPEADQSTDQSAVGVSKPSTRSPVDRAKLPPHAKTHRRHGCVLGLFGLAYGKGKDVTVKVKHAQGKDLGAVVIKPVGTGVSLKLNLNGLPLDEHAIHFHQKAKCDAPEFKSAQGGNFETRRARSTVWRTRRARTLVTCSTSQSMKRARPRQTS